MIPKTTRQGNNNQTCAQVHFASIVVHRKRKVHIQKCEPSWGFWLRFYKALIFLFTFNILTYALSLSVFPLWLILYKISISSLSVIWEDHSALASLSRSHSTWPDFPILHQTLTRISFSNFMLCWVPLTSLKHAWFYLCFELIRMTIHFSNPFLPIFYLWGKVKWYIVWVWVIIASRFSLVAHLMISFLLLFLPKSILEVLNFSLSPPAFFFLIAFYLIHH